MCLLGPLLFLLLIHSVVAKQNHQKNAYKNDITLSDPAPVVAAGVTLIKTEGALKDLILNETKYEAIKQEGQIIKPVLQQHLGLITVHDDLILLHVSFSSPRLQHIMRAPPCHVNEYLLKLHQLL